MKNKKTTTHIESLILRIRGQRVIIDTDLANLYGVSTMRLNEQVKRNRVRFPQDFTFQLTPEEKSEVIANCDNLKKLKFSPVPPNAFTEYGAIMPTFHKIFKEVGIVPISNMVL